jgi:hypothetical protein
MGDVHPQGNPHYWLDPSNGRRIAQAIQKKFAELDPADGAYFAQRYADFDKRLREVRKVGRDDGALQGTKSSRITGRGRTSWSDSASTSSDTSSRSRAFRRLRPTRSI